MVGLVAAAEFLKAQHLEREARHREYLAAEERRCEAERHRQIEEARARALDADLAAWRTASTIRQYATAMRHSAAAAGLVDEGAPMTTYLAWVEAYADDIDPAVGTPAVPADPKPQGWSGYGYGGGAPSPRSLW